MGFWKDDENAPERSWWPSLFNIARFISSISRIDFDNIIDFFDFFN